MQGRNAIFKHYEDLYQLRPLIIPYLLHSDVLCDLTDLIWK